jgi:hypothetical protein
VVPGVFAASRPPSASSGVLASSNPNPLQLSPPVSQPKISDRVGQPPAQSDTAQPANSPGSGPVAAVAQRVVLYEEDPADPKGKQYVGSVISRTEPIERQPETGYRGARGPRNSRPQVQDDDVVPP